MQRLILWLICSLCSFAVAGCSSKLLINASPQAAFYRLQRVAEEPPALETNAHGLYIAPIKLATYLQRPQMVQRTGPYRYQFQEYQRWAEPLAENIRRLLQQSLQQQLPQAQIRAGNRSPTGSWTLDIDVSRCNATPTGVELSLDWRLSPPGEAKATAVHGSFQRHWPTAKKAAAWVEHLSQGFTALSRHIAQKWAHRLKPSDQA